MMKTIRVALIFGGRSAEHEVSITSASAISKNLDPKKYSVINLYIDRNGLWTILDSPALSAKLPVRGRAFSFLPWGNKSPGLIPRPDIYFPVLHGPCGEDGTIQGILEMADVPYVGAGVLASALGMDKASSKSLFRDKGLPVVGHKILLAREWARRREGIIKSLGHEFQGDLFVKPSNLGSSVGITKVKHPPELESALDRAFRYDHKVLVEESIEGREFECAILGNDEPRASLPGEVIASREFYDYRDKYLDGKTKFVVPARLAPSLIREIQDLALDAFRAIDGAGMARVDFFHEEKRGKLYLNEINTIPGFTEISLFPRLWEATGLPFPQLVDRLIELGLERHASKRRCVDWDVP